MQVFENIATILVYLSLGVLFVCVIISLILSFGTGRFYESFNKFYKKVGFFFCLPVCGLSFLSEGFSKNNSVLNFVLAGISFLLLILIIWKKKKRKKIKEEDLGEN